MALVEEVDARLEKVAQHLTEGLYEAFGGLPGMQARTMRELLAPDTPSRKAVQLLLAGLLDTETREGNL